MVSSGGKVVDGGWLDEGKRMGWSTGSIASWFDDERRTEVRAASGGDDDTNSLRLWTKGGMRRSAPEREMSRCSRDVAGFLNHADSDENRRQTSQTPARNWTVQWGFFQW
jgi:hypothetical protein